MSVRGVGPGGCTREESERELAAVLASSAFVRSARMETLLAWLCAQLFSGQADQITEYRIGVDALGRRESFDPSTDAIARVEVHRLRRKLRDYYHSEGAAHAIQIEIPAGTYAPAFIRTNALTTAAHAPIEVPAPAVPAESASGTVLIGAPAAPPMLLRRPPWLRILAVALSLVIAVTAILLFRGAQQSHSLPVARAAALTSADSASLPRGGAIRILCGATAPHVDRQGRVWGADRFFSGGGIQERTRQFLSRTADFTLYSHSRFGTFSYDIPAAPGTYNLHLFFAETQYGPGMPLGGGETSRLLNVDVNGRPMLQSFDIIGDAGGPGIADERVFKDIEPASDGKVHIQFTGLRENATVDAISLVPAPAHKMNPVRLTVQDVSYTDSKGNIWNPDDYWAGGQKPFRISPVHDTPDPGLFATERYGNFSYAIPVAQGSYELNVYSVETYWGAQNAGGEGQRLFDILCNGVALARRVDIIRQAGANRALILHYTGLRPNSQGKLTLSFVPIQNYATLCALEILDDSK